MHCAIYVVDGKFHAEVFSALGKPHRCNSGANEFLRIAILYGFSTDYNSTFPLVLRLNVFCGLS